MTSRTRTRTQVGDDQWGEHPESRVPTLPAHNGPTPDAGAPCVHSCGQQSTQPGNMLKGSLERRRNASVAARWVRRRRVIAAQMSLANAQGLAHLP